MGKRPHHPRRGSVGYSPRVRAKSPIGRIRSWITDDTTRVQGFAGYKVGMTHVVKVDDIRNSPTYGQEIAKAATVIEVPPMVVCGVRTYKRTTNGLQVLAEGWAKKQSDDLARKIPTIKPGNGIGAVEKTIEDAVELRLITHTQPRLAAVPKKKPEIMEWAIGGPKEEGLALAKELLGKEVGVSDVLKEGEFLDVIGVTKGKGFQPPIKRWGTKHLPRKDRKGRATAGNLGPTNPAAMKWTVPTSGQMGYHHRTELNKQILKIGTSEDDVNPAGGFLHYGLVKGDFLLIEGSVPGPRKRMLRFRPAVRPPARVPEGVPQLVNISKTSKQGV